MAANRSYCNTCKSLVPSRRDTRDGKVYLLKDCPKCGTSETLISSDATRHFRKREMDPGHTFKPCASVKCTTCNHHRRPRYAFVDVTNRCNLNCPMCADSVPGHGFAFDPPMEHFKKIFDHLAQFDPLPAIALFGGEPTVRKDLVDIIKLSRSYGFETRVLTNGIRLADEGYCRELVAARPHLLVSYDGCKPSTYLELRNNEKVLALKQKAIENLNKLPRAKVSYVTCFSWGLNDKDLPEILEFCHRQRRILHGIYLMPLVQTWDPSQFELQPQRMTTEDVEQFLADCYPDHDVQFISLGLASQFQAIAKVLGRDPLPYYGTHPNCESFYLLVSDGERYLPVDHFLKCSLTEVIESLVKLENRLLAREKRWKHSLFGRFLGALGLRNFVYRQTGKLGVLKAILPKTRLGRFFKGKGIGKMWHGLMTMAEHTVGCKSRKVRERHMLARDMLRVIILPLEDDPILETERLERCPSVHVYYDPRSGDFKYVPVCAWRLHNKKILADLAEQYGALKPEEEPVGVA